MPRRALEAGEKLQLLAGKVHPKIRAQVEEWAWRDRSSEAAIVREAIEDYVRRRLKREAQRAAA